MDFVSWSWIIAPVSRALNTSAMGSKAAAAPSTWRVHFTADCVAKLKNEGAGKTSSAPVETDFRRFHAAHRAYKGSRLEIRLFM